MAGDWIKMREDLYEDPAVLFIAQRLQTRPEHVVGYCHKFWCWVSRQCRDGIVTGVPILSLGSVLGMPGFAELLCEVGWLEYDDSVPEMPVIRIPKFERHLSQGAKARALAAEKKRLQRVPFLSQNCPRDLGTREEKRRVYIDNNNKGASSRFSPPTLSEVQAYCEARSNAVDPQQFLDYYTANGWRVGKNPMKDWKAAVRTWEKNARPTPRPAGKNRNPVYLDETE